MLLSPAQLDELKERHASDEVAVRWVRLRRKDARTLIGPCPICSNDLQSKAATRFEVTSDGWVCAVCADGGDVIKLVMKVEGRDFRGAVDWLGGAREVNSAEAEARERAKAAKQAQRERDNMHYRERERRRLYQSFWQPVWCSPRTAT